MYDLSYTLDIAVITQSEVLVESYSSILKASESASFYNSSTQTHRRDYFQWFKQ